MGVGKRGTASRAGIAEDLVESIEKDLDKLKRQRDNLLQRRAVAMNVPVDNRTTREIEEDEKDRMRREMQREENANIIHASPNRI